MKLRNIFLVGIRQACGQRRGRNTLFSLALLVPIGFYSKFYGGPAASWVNNSLGGLFYVVFWCLVASLFTRRARPWAIALAVTFVTCLLEGVQLWRNPLLDLLRAGFLGRTLLGTTFMWSDFPYYFAGGGVGWIWVRGLRRTDLRDLDSPP